ncbi:MAG: DUF5615 family PIN-like protein [Candidatus Binatia bacterium]
MARLYANENFPQPVVDALRALGHDVLSTRDAGRSGKGVPDSEVLHFAVSDGRAVLTINWRAGRRISGDIHGPHSPRRAAAHATIRSSRRADRARWRCGCGGRCSARCG